MTWATSVPILVFLGLSVLELGLMYATDRRQTKASLNASSLWGRRHNNNNNNNNNKTTTTTMTTTTTTTTTSVCRAKFPAKLHPDRPTFERTAAENNTFSTRNRGLPDRNGSCKQCGLRYKLLILDTQLRLVLIFWLNGVVIVSCFI